MDRTKEFTQKDIDENKDIAWLAYFGILFTVPILSESKYAHFHGKQGMILFIDEIIMGIFIFVCHILASYEIMPWIFRPLRTVLCIMFFVGMIFYVCYGVINVVKGKAKELPLIGKNSK